MLTAVELTPGSSSTVHIYTQTIHRTTQLIWEECRPCPVFASYTLEFALQLRKTHGKTSVKVAEECQLVRWKQNIQNRTYITIRTKNNIYSNWNVLCFLVDCLLSELGWTTDSRLKSTALTNCSIYKLYFLVMGYKYARNI